MVSRASSLQKSLTSNNTDHPTLVSSLCDYLKPQTLILAACLPHLRVECLFEQVNAEIKRLLVASVGEDVGNRYITHYELKTFHSSLAIYVT